MKENELVGDNANVKPKSDLGPAYSAWLRIWTGLDTTEDLHNLPHGLSPTDTNERVEFGHLA